MLRSRFILSGHVPTRRRHHGYRLMSNLADTFVEVGGSEDSGAPMVFIPGGTFRMGSDQHYPEEAPAHRVTIDSFWIDRTPVTNCQFREFV